jgi:hypothetical protein
VGELAASLAMVPPGSRLSAAELLTSIEPASWERHLATGAAVRSAQGSSAPAAAAPG